MPGMRIGGGDATRFVGRERELDAILEAVRDAAAGRSSSLLLAAPSGMGSSRLLDAAIRQLLGAEPSGEATLTILRSDALPAWRGAPYAPFRWALDRHLSALEPAVATQILGPAAELLRPLLPGMAARLAGVPTREPSRERLAERIREAVRAVLHRLAATGPVLLVVEDLHVLDAASRSLVAFLARTLGDHPILLVGTYQPDAVGRGHPFRATLDELGAGPRAPRRLALPPLDRAELRAFIAAHEGDPPTAPTLLLVAERSGGSPLVAEEVLAARRELSGSSLTLPLEQLVVARAALRSPECRRAMRILAVAGGPLRLPELAAVAAAYDVEVGRPAPRSAAPRRRGAAGTDGDLAAGIEEAIEHGFVTPLGGAIGAHPPVRPGRERRGRDGTGRDGTGRGGGAHVRIRHELLAQGLVADLLPGPRRLMHASVASVLEGHPVEVGRHWHRAHEAGRELAAESAAAAAAEEVGASADALVHLERAIELAGAPVATGIIDAAGQLDLLLRAADASDGVGDAGRAAAFVESAIARHPDPRDRIARATLTERLAAFAGAGGDRDAALAAYERALELLPTTPSPARVRLLASTAQVRMLEGAFSDAGRVAALAIDTARQAGSEARPWLAHATCTLGVVDSWLGRPEAAVAHLEEALAIAVELGRLDDAFRARANLATALDLQGRRAEAIDVSRQGIAAAEADGLEVAHGNILRGNAVDALVSLGRWDEAREMAERALAWAPSGMPFVIAALGLAIVETETRAGETAAALLGRLFLELETIQDTQSAVPAYEAAASLALWRGDLADASRAVGAAWARVRGTEHWALAARTAAAAMAVADARARAALERRHEAEATGARSWADGILSEAVRMVDESGVPADSWLRRQVDADLASARAFRARLAGRDDPGAWAAVAGRWRAVDRVYDLARALFYEAEAHLDGGAQSGARRAGRDEARAPLLEAVGIALALDAQPLLRALGDLAARSRIALPEPARERLATLGAESGGSTADAEVGAPPPIDRRSTLSPRGETATAASFGLSPRERGVLAEIVAGRTNRQIGERLFISEKTVGVHVGNILAKLGVGGRVEAATVALRLGLVDELLESSKKPGPRGPGSRGRRGGAA